MRKIVLAKITPSETEALISLEANVSTYRTLLMNQFISEADKGQIKTEYRNKSNELSKKYADILKKYNVPYIARSKYGVSPDEHCIFVKVY